MADFWPNGGGVHFPAPDSAKTVGDNESQTGGDKITNNRQQELKQQKQQLER